ncbi:DUF4743 domain-containing protein [Azospirillum thermophilum]|uniref:DUF4743 domain-containing protein n=1 Tax=Azospirillum thermophilum TaxID=2202148 RepID=UPI0031835A94
MSFMDRIRACNAHDLSGFRPFELEGHRLGWISHSLADRLPSIDPGFVSNAERVTLAPEIRDFEARSAVLQHAAEFLFEEGRVAKLRGEYYPVAPRWGRSRWPGWTARRSPPSASNPTDCTSTASSAGRTGRCRCGSGGGRWTARSAPASTTT